MILSCGEAVVDMVPETGIDGATPWHSMTGGAAVNSAIALARLGQSVGFFGALSQDQFGEMLRHRMTVEGVDLSHAVAVETPSTLAMNDDSPAGLLCDPPCPLTPHHIPPMDAIDALVFGGIGLIHPPAAGLFEATMQLAGPARLTLLDTNICPSLKGADVAGYCDRLERMMAMADVIILPDEDCDWLGTITPERLLSGRSSLVLHNHGAGGVTFFSRHGSGHVPASNVAVADSVGAGDIFNAGLLASLATQGMLRPDRLATASQSSLLAAVQYGVQAATFSRTQAGANPPYAKDLT